MDSSQQPEMQRKTRNPFKIVTIILSVLVLGLAGLSAWQFINSLNDNQTESQNNYSADSESTKNTEAARQDNDLAVRNVINSIKKDVDAHMLRSAYPYAEKTYDTFFPTYQPDNANSGIPLNKSYGLMISGTNDEGTTLIVADDLVPTITGVLDNLGFAPYDKITEIFRGGTPSTQYINNKTGIICDVSAGSSPQEVSCGHVSWLNADDVELSIKLSEAYKNKEGNYPSTISARVDDIKDSSYQPYQKIHAWTGGAVGIFYRVNTESEWIFFAGGHQALGCSLYNSDDLKKAFAGDECVDDVSGNILEVKP